MLATGRLQLWLSERLSPHLGSYSLSVPVSSRVSTLWDMGPLEVQMAKTRSYEVQAGIRALVVKEGLGCSGT